MTQPHPPRTWTERLTAARLRPWSAIGHETSAHKYAAVVDPLRLVWEKLAFETPSRSTVRLSATQFHTTCEAGPFLRPLAEAVNWSTGLNLHEELEAILVRTDANAYSPGPPFYESTFVISAISRRLVLMDRFVLALRTEEGLWCQTFRHGWPVIPPTLVTENPNGIGLMVAGALAPGWFTGLPFTLKEAQKAVPREARPHTEVVWCPEDELVPDCPHDAHCILDPENLPRWL